jgi:hypothetical protein
MTRRQFLPAGLLALTLLATGACTTGGLRVEGARSPVTATPPSTSAPSQSPGPQPLGTKNLDDPGRTDQVVTLEKIRQTLLADDRVDVDARKLLKNCQAVDRCLRRGVTVNVMHTGYPQQVVTVNTLDGLVFGGFLLALEPSGPRLVWSLNADGLQVYRGGKGELVVESKVYGTNDHVCCPSGSRVEVYRWNGRKLTRISSQHQRGG